MRSNFTVRFFWVELVRVGDELK